ncbi:hypothetical protein [Streptomyces sp. NPDC052225]|uniref:hypothetical protein n=1 Tax=Streptomyces sp. NPDC052225 TaxID=3154949 RepID=UPI00341FD0E7
MLPTGETAIRAWPDGVRGRAEAAVLPAGRPVRAEVYDADALAELRALTSTGGFADGICRCPGGTTLDLADRGGLRGFPERVGATC